MLFSSVVVVAFYEQNMCRFLSDYVQNKPLSRSMETRRFSPRKKEERFIFQKMNFFARRARARRDTCVFPKFLTEREILISRLVGAGVV